MITAENIEMKPSSFGGFEEPEQLAGIAAETTNQDVQIGIWESGPGVLNLNFKWSETVYVLEGRAEVTNIKTLDTFFLTPGSMALFEAGSEWSWRIPWKLKKVFTIIDK